MRLSHKKIHYNKLREPKYQEEKPAEVAENQGAAKAGETKKPSLKLKVLDLHIGQEEESRAGQYADHQIRLPRPGVMLEGATGCVQSDRLTCRYSAEDNTAEDLFVANRSP